MRRFAFISVAIGMLVLALLMEIGPKEILSKEELDGLVINTKVVVSGEVLSERMIDEQRKIFEIDNGIELVCKCQKKYLGEKIKVEGVVADYLGNRQITVLKINP